jgi:sialate O-acetylesterase
MKRLEVIKLRVSLFLLISLLATGYRLVAQSYWPGGKQAAICLTYDDGFINHLDIVGPQLDSFNLKGTFFVPGYTSCLDSRINDWRDLAVSGHELGNHTLFHPCDWSSIGMGRPYGHGDLIQYTFEQLIMELETANTLLKAVDGQDNRTFAYTCSQYKVENVDFSDSLSHLFSAARADGPIPETMRDFNVFKTPSWCVPENTTADELIEYCVQAKKKGTIAIFMFHGIGEKTGYGWFNITSSDHLELLKYLRKNANDYYCATFSDVMNYIMSKQKKPE